MMASWTEDASCDTSALDRLGCWNWAICFGCWRIFFVLISKKNTGPKINLYLNGQLNYVYEVQRYSG